MPEDVKRADEVSALRAQVAIAQAERRSRSTFYELKPDIFYYLFSLVFSLTAPWLTGARRLGLRSIITAGLCFAILCGVPGPWNRLRYWLLIRRPNQLLERKIASLEAQIKQLQGER